MTESYDIELVQRAQNGDVEAVGELFDRHHEPIFRFAWSRVGDRQVAEDLTGEVFTRTVRSLPDYRLEGIPFRAWLYRVVVLRFLVGLSLEEVAAAVDKTTAAVKSLQHRGLKSLRLALRAA